VSRKRTLKHENAIRRSQLTPNHTISVSSLIPHPHFYSVPSFSAPAKLNVPMDRVGRSCILWCTTRSGYTQHTNPQKARAPLHLHQPKSLPSPSLLHLVPSIPAFQSKALLFYVEAGEIDAGVREDLHRPYVTP